MSRTCRLLAGGKTVAWFQNAGGGDAAERCERVVLSDPTARFVRDNVNGFLLHQPLDVALPVAMTVQHAGELLIEPPPPFELRRSQARPELADAFGAAVDDQGMCLVRAVDTADADELWRPRGGMGGVDGAPCARGGRLIARWPRGSGPESGRAGVFLQRHRCARHGTVPADEGLLADAFRRVTRRDSE